VSERPPSRPITLYDGLQSQEDKVRLTADVTSTAARRGGVLLLAGLAGAALLLAGCSAGQNAQTAHKKSAVAGARADLDGIALREVQIAYPGREHRTYETGETAPLEARIFNNGTKADALVKISSDAAESVRLVGSDGTDSEVCTAAKVSAPAEPSAPESPSESASPSGAPSPAESEPAGTADFSIDLAPDSCALLVAGQPYHLELTGLRQAVAPGATVPITFRFANAGEVTLKVPVGSPTEGADNEPVPMRPVEPSIVGGGE
jgi:hypothetical protein